MTEVKGVGKRRTQLFHDLRNRRRLKERAEDKKRSIEHKEEIKVIFPKSMDLLISSIHTNNSL